jgi:hypothetical protein
MVSVAGIRTRGTMLWFNTVTDVGALETNDGDKIGVPGNAFAPGEKPVGRCAGRAIECKLDDGVPSGITFVPDPTGGRARLRHRG